MKQYIIALRSLDFNKSGKSWSTDAIDLYNNKFYTNYSITRSRFGLDVIGDKTFVGTEIVSDATPTIVVSGATPVSVTNYGEIVKETGVITYNIFEYDEASGQYFIFNLIEDASPFFILDPTSVEPDLFRFVDTTSKIDLLSYKAAFTNIASDDEPTYSVKIYEAESPEGPWMLSSVSSDIGTLFLTDVKRYSKIEVEITSELQAVDVENFGFVFILEVAIANPVSPVLTKSAKNILRRFPSWMKMFEDSVDQATPETYIPQTVGGKFINSLISDYPEDFEKQKDFFELDRTITTADIEQSAWIYATSDVLPSHLSVQGDNVQLSRVNTIAELYEARENDYCYYYNPSDREMITTKLFKYIYIDNSLYEQTPLLKWNWFDEFGSRVGLKRLYLENNANFKLRILDVYKNLPSVSKNNFKVTLRRELDIWSAYGATPDSDYLGATPETIEIEDMEKSTPYFSFAGNPQKEFKDIVSKINQKYPVNWGYVRWDNGFWDYAGQDQAGVGRISAVYDEQSSPLGAYYQPGVGDTNDAVLAISEPVDSSISFNTSFTASGVYKSGTTTEYSPITFEYESYGSYYQEVYSNEAATVNFRYVLTMPAHASYATPGSYYVDVASNPVNSYGINSPASPEYNLIKIFDTEGYSLDEYQFRNLQNGDLYLDRNATPYSNKINFYNSSKASATPMSGSNNFGIKFADSTPVSGVIGSPIDIVQQYYSVGSNDIKVVSNKYNTRRDYFYTTPRIPGKITINSINDNDSTEGVVLDQEFIQNNIIFPPGSTPAYYHIDNIKPFGYEENPSMGYIEDQYAGYGGLSLNSNLGVQYLTPSSPNIIARYSISDFATPENYFGFVGGPASSSSVDYYFATLKYPYDSTPNQIYISTDTSSVYPYTSQSWDSFSINSSTPMISGTVNKNGVVGTVEINDETISRNSNIVGFYNLNYDDFNIDPNNYIIQKIEVVNNIDGINLSIPNEFVYATAEENSFYTNAIVADEFNNLNNIKVTAEYEGVYDSYLHSGWYSQNEEDYYIYAKPLEESYSTPGFELKLEEVARQGAPIIINRNLATPTQLREVAFYDAASPTVVSIINSETVYGNGSADLYLGYEDVYNVTVTDKVTGYTIIENASTSSNQIRAFSDATPSVYGRAYDVTYKVKDSYIVDNDYYDLDSEKYVTKITFDATPNEAYSYGIVYESSITTQATPVTLTVDPTQLWDQEGFIYLSHNDYNFKTADINLSPSYLVDNQDDYSVVTINSLDINNNSKPYQTFRITGPYITADEQYITTDINGFGFVNVRYSGTIPSSTPGSYILVEGVTNGSPSAHANSQTQGFSTYFNFDLITSYESQNSLKAIADSPVIYADGVSEQYIRGVISSSATPNSANIVYWRKGRTLQDVFDATPYSDYVRANQRGEFSIGPISAEAPGNPGYWIVAVETAHSTNITTSPVTVSGDIVFWSEKYDNLNYHISNGIMYNRNVLLNQGEDMYSTPNFTVNFIDGSNAPTYNVDPNWLPPKWYPINRFDQYQMGLLGATPDVVQSYSDLMNDYEEE
jgi:hypothetical protein